MAVSINWGLERGLVVFFELIGGRFRVDMAVSTNGASSMGCPFHGSP